MLTDSPLGKESHYEHSYNPDLLFAIARKPKRDEIGIAEKLPFSGLDLWNHYEVSWLNEKGKPVVAIAEIMYDCASPNMIESKSMKLYFNSFNQTKFSDENKIQKIIENDLSVRVGSPVQARVYPLSLSSRGLTAGSSATFFGICLDHLDVECEVYEPDANILQVENNVVSEVLYSDLLKSNCLVTGQPDWGSIQITYAGKKIIHESLLKYIISFRDHNEFHEQCIERIFVDILKMCQPTSLTVYGRYTRRGGIDINPLRTTEKNFKILNNRLLRQ